MRLRSLPLLVLLVSATTFAPVVSAETRGEFEKRIRCQIDCVNREKCNEKVEGQRQKCREQCNASCLPKKPPPKPQPSSPASS